MVTQYDEKGKIFTQVVSKHPAAVVIQTDQQTSIRGTIHVRPNARVKDEMNGNERFIAVTDAVIYNSQGEEISRVPFLVVNTDHIVWLIPQEETNR